MYRTASVAALCAVALFLLAPIAHAQTTSAVARSVCGALTLTAGQQYPANQDTSGNLCTSASVSVTSVTANQGTPNGGGASSWPVTQNYATVGTGTLQSAATGSGNGTTLSTVGMNSAVLTVNCATCSGGTQVNFEGTQDGTNYSLINGMQLGTANAPAAITTTSGIAVWKFDVAGLQNIRARISAYSAGTITVTGTASPTPLSPLDSLAIINALTGSTPSGTNLIGKVGFDQTTPGVTNAVSTFSPCTSVINITQTSTTDVHTFTNIGYICSVVLVSATAQSIGLDEGTGTTCESSGTALIGVSSTSAATPTMAVAANGGFSSVAGAPWLKLLASADHLCVLQSGSGNVSGVITYVDHS